MQIRSASLIIAAQLAIPAVSAQQIFMNRSWKMDGDTTTVMFGSPRGFAPRPVMGAPFTADRVNQLTQTLADGTHIRQPANVEHISRDSQGRTRSERTPFPNMARVTGQNPADFKIVEITDSVAGVACMIDDQNKVAHRVALQALVQRRPAVGAAGAGPGSPTVSNGVVIGSAAGVGGGTGVASARAPDGRRPQFVTEKLGSKNIEGVIAEGTRTTTTWPVESQGNDRPIVEIGESWFSPELKQMILFSRTTIRATERPSRS